MEISLEKIELVKDRTGVNYKEAKDALIKADGSVVDAIIMIEDEIDLAPKSKAGDQASQLIEKVKQLIKKGNVSKIVVKKDDDVILNIPVSLGIVGAVWVFWPTLVATVVALGMKCSIELIKDDGEVINLSDKAVDTFGGVKENCSVLADDLKGKSGDAFTQVKGKAADVISKAKAGAENVEEVAEEVFETVEETFEGTDDDDLDINIDLNIDIDDDDDIDCYDDDYFNFDDFVDIEDEEEIDDTEAEAESDSSAQSADDAVFDVAEEIFERTDSVEDTVEEDAEIAENEAEEVVVDKEEKSAEQTESAAQSDISDEILKAGEKFEETIANYKKKKGRFRFFD